jgi:subtilisin family serine protease
MNRVYLGILLLIASLGVCPLTAGDVDIAESHHGAMQVAPLSDLSSALADTSTMKYYGATVRTVYLKQPASSIVRVFAAQKAFGPGTGIVAVIDTGVDPYHPALAGALVPGYDFIRGAAGLPSEWMDLTAQQAAALAGSAAVPATAKTIGLSGSSSAVPMLDQSTVVILDGGGATLPGEFGHGTMVAGLIHLVAPGAKIMPLKAFSADGTAKMDDVVSAINYAVDNGANVINMSFSVQGNDPNLQTAVEYAASKGVVMVAASGNDGSERPVYPAAYSEVIGVGSVNNVDQRSLFSNYDSKAARTSAPGEALITVYPGNNYAGVWGTSFSTALVSGAAAMALQIDPTGAHTAVYHGQPISQDMGDTRLQILTGLSYLKSGLSGGHD